MYMNLIKLFLCRSFSRQRREPKYQKLQQGSLPNCSLFSGTPRSKDSRTGATNRDGLHINDKLFAVGLGVAVAVMLVLDFLLALMAAAMLLDAAAEDSATKACEKLAVP